MLGNLFGMFTSTGLEGLEGFEGAETAMSGIFGFLAGLGMFVGIIFLAFGVLGIFMARGAFKGQKWSPIVSSILAILGILSTLTSIANIDTSLIVNLIISLFTGYCAYICIIHPYFGAKAKAAEPPAAAPKA